MLGHGRLDNLQPLSKFSWVVCVYLLENTSNVSQPDKLRGVFTDCSAPLTQLQLDLTHFEVNHMHLTFCPAEDETSTHSVIKYQVRFFWSQILLDAILSLRAPQPHENIMADLLKECRLFYKDNFEQVSKINEFALSYSPERAIYWYTCDSFVYKLLNKALRMKNIMVLFKFRTIIQDVYQQLKIQYQRQRVELGK